MESTITPQLATNSAKDIIGHPFSTLSYWFSTPTLGSLNHWPVLLLASLSTLVLISVLVIVAVKNLRTGLTPPQQKFLTKSALLLAAFGPIGWILVLARNFGVVFFSARFWWVLWLIALVVLLIWLYRDFKKLPSQQLQYQSYQLKKRYFPKKKKR